MSAEPCALRGYIASRPFMGERAPQHVQNLVIRDYCRRIGTRFLLSATEYAMPGCFMMLEQLVAENESKVGIAAYSLFMLPSREVERRRLYARLLDNGRALHCALESLEIATPEDIERAEDMWLVRSFMDRLRG